jgi:hypothetical protein
MNAVAPELKEVPEMAFTTAFIAHAPDADAEKSPSLYETPTYKLFTAVVRDQPQAVSTAKALVEKEGVESIILCPGFTNKDVAEMSDAVGGGVGVFVARGDGPSGAAAMRAMQREGWH